MKRQVLIRSKLCATALSMILALSPVFAQTQKPDIAVSIFRDLVRFTAPGDVPEMRVEVFNSTGQKVFEGSLVSGQTQDWPLQDLQSQPVDSGLYSYTITTKDQAGALKQMQQGNLIVDRGREGLEAAPPVDSSHARPPQSIKPKPTGTWDVDHGEDPYIINTPAMGIGTQTPLAHLQLGAGTNEPLTKGSTLLLEEGEATGMVLKSTTGAEMFFSQDKNHGLFGTATNQPLGIRTNNLNRFWITGEGNVGIGTINPSSPLTVAGVIETTSGGIKFPDGTIQTSAANASSGNPTSDAGNISKGASQNIGANQDRSSGKKGPNDKTVSPEFSVNEDLTVNGNIIFTSALSRDITMAQNTGGIRIFAAPTLTGQPSSAAIQFFGTGHAGFPGQAFIDSGAHDSAAVIFRTAPTGGTITERMRVTSTGNVGIGTAGSPPAQLLELRSSSEPLLRVTNTAPEMAGAFLDIGMNKGNNAAFFQATNGKDFKFFNGQYAFTIAGSNGNVGIGTTNPGQKLDVYGAAASIRVGSSTDSEHGVNVTPDGTNERAYLYTTGGNANHAGRLRLSNGNSDTTFANIAMRNAAGTTVNYITNNGNSYFNGGNVGIGTPTPEFAKLDVRGTDTVVQVRSSMSTIVNGSNNGGAIYFGVDNANNKNNPTAAIETSWGGGLNPQIGIGVTRDFAGNRTANMLLDYSGNTSIKQGVTSRLFVQADTGNVGVGTTVPQRKLEVDNPFPQIRLKSTEVGGRTFDFGVGTNAFAIQEFASDGTLLGTRLSIEGETGKVTVKVLEINDGADLSEQFEIKPASNSESGAMPLQIQPGLVVAIDPNNTGKLVVSSLAYDRRVAGIISGAGGVKPGLLMSQSGSIADGSHPVALTGRVYCWADASNGPISPGDLLTTSNVSGHAMKATDQLKAQGAIIGKAMTELKQGRGLVLVLVTLQ